MKKSRKKDEIDFGLFQDRILKDIELGRDAISAFQNGRAPHSHVPDLTHTCLELKAFFIGLKIK
jgi:hypothetical protein